MLKAITSGIISPRVDIFAFTGQGPADGGFLEITSGDKRPRVFMGEGGPRDRLALVTLTASPNARNTKEISEFIKKRIKDKMQTDKPPLAQSNGQPKRSNRHNPDFHTSVLNCPSTRRTPALYAYEYIEKPGIARGNLAVSTTRPYGNTEYMKKYRDYVGSLSSSTRAELTKSRPHYNNMFYSGTAMEMA